MSHKLFASQLDNETVCLVVRRHPIFLLSKLALLTIFLIVIVVGRAFLDDIFIGSLADSMKVLTTLVMHILIAGTLFAGFALWALYYLHMQIITNVRIVDVNQVSLLHREVSELNISNVQDVSSEITGVLGTMLTYGDVLVQTAGVQQKFVFEKVAHPESIKKLLLD